MHAPIDLIKKWHNNLTHFFKINYEDFQNSILYNMQKISATSPTFLDTWILSLTFCTQPINIYIYGVNIVPYGEKNIKRRGKRTLWEKNIPDFIKPPSVKFPRSLSSINLRHALGLYANVKMILINSPIGSSGLIVLPWWWWWWWWSRSYRISILQKRITQLPLGIKSILLHLDLFSRLRSGEIP